MSPVSVPGSPRLAMQYRVPAPTGAWSRVGLTRHLGLLPCCSGRKRDECSGCAVGRSEALGIEGSGCMASCLSAELSESDEVGLLRVVDPTISLGGIEQRLRVYDPFPTGHKRLSRR